MSPPYIAIPMLSRVALKNLAYLELGPRRVVPSYRVVHVLASAVSPTLSQHFIRHPESEPAARRDAAAAG